MKSIKKLINQRIEWKNDITNATKIFSDDIEEIKKLHELKMQDKWNNQFHLSSYSGLINDPNGLMKNNGKYHIFYQWAPYKPIHALKHWGHFETKDFINYKHTGLAIEPSLKEDANGIFSGGGFSENEIPYVFWTGNIKPFGSEEKNRSSYTLVGKWDETNNKIIDKKVLFQVNKNYYTGHFRDPKPLKINNKFYLLHGAQKKDLTGTLSIYKSNSIDKDYQLMGDLKILPKIKNAGFMWECPDCININGKEFLVFSPQGKSFYQKSNENRDNVVFVQGKLDIETLTFHRLGDLQIIDEGYDFYAPQTFSNAGRQILIGWAGIGEADPYATFNNMWANNLTLSRELSINKNNKVLQNPLVEYENLRIKKLAFSRTYDLKESRLIELNVEFKDVFSFELINNKGENISFKFVNDEFYSSRENMSFDQAPNYGRTRTRKHYSLFNQARVFIDNSLIEIYANNGEFVFTSKYWLEGNIKLNISKTKKQKVYHLKSFEVEWNV